MGAHTPELVGLRATVFISTRIFVLHADQIRITHCARSSPLALLWALARRQCPSSSSTFE